MTTCRLTRRDAETIELMIRRCGSLEAAIEDSTRQLARIVERELSDLRDVMVWIVAQGTARARLMADVHEVATTCRGGKCLVAGACSHGLIVRNACAACGARICGACGDITPAGVSCGCFDNGCE